MTILLTINMFCFIVVVLTYIGTITVAKSMAQVNNENNIFYMYWSRGPP